MLRRNTPGGRLPTDAPLLLQRIRVPDTQEAAAGKGAGACRTYDIQRHSIIMLTGKHMQAFRPLLPHACAWQAYAGSTLADQAACAMSVNKRFHATEHTDQVSTSTHVKLVPEPEQSTFKDSMP